MFLLSVGMDLSVLMYAGNLSVQGSQVTVLVRSVNVNLLKILTLVQQ